MGMKYATEMFANKSTAYKKPEQKQIFKINERFPLILTFFCI